jgi:hypothetical protein
MTSYVITTGIVFALLVVSHVWRVAVEGAYIIREPVFLVTTLLSVALTIWALVLLRRLSRTRA